MPPPRTHIYPIFPSSTSTIPYTALATVPQTDTCPAMVNIFTMVPGMMPLRLSQVKHKLCHILDCRK